MIKVLVIVNVFTQYTATAHERQQERGKFYKNSRRIKAQRDKLKRIQNTKLTTLSETRQEGMFRIKRHTQCRAELN